MRSPLVLASLLLALPLLALSSNPHSSVGVNRSHANSLNRLYKSMVNKYIGTCTDQALLEDPQNAQLIKQQFGVLTPENSMKWDTVQSTRGHFDFAKADAVANFAKENRMLLRIHCLVWYEQLASWVNNIKDRKEMIQVMSDHFKAILTRYPEAYAIDVVNEAFEEDGSFRKNVFYNVLNEDYIPIAFKLARQFAPKAQLYINDYNLDKVSGNEKLASLVKHVKTWRAQGIPIDAIGSQTHISTAFDPSEYARALTTLCNVATTCAVTELDVKNADPAVFKAVVDACTATSKCVGVSVWGVRDSDSWRANTTPLLFDASFKPKPAFFAMMQQCVASRRVTRSR